MPVTSPRRTSILSSGGSNFTTSSTSSPSASVTARSNTYKSYLDRADSLSKYSSLLSSSTSAYSPSSSSYSSYSPRLYSSYRSPTSSLSGGSSGIGTYRSTASTLNDTNSSSRCGLNEQRDKWRNQNKPPTGADNSGSQIKRTPGVCSSAALARLVATSALDIYEKYSPANYKPNTELSGSRSSALTETNAVRSTDKDDDRDNTTTHRATHNRYTSRYGRWYSQQESIDEVDNITQTRSRTRSSPQPLIVENDKNLTAATMTLRSSRVPKAKVYTEGHTENNNNENNDETQAVNKLNKLHLNADTMNELSSGDRPHWNSSRCSGLEDYMNIKNGDDIKQKCDPVNVARPQTINQAIANTANSNLNSSSIQKRAETSTYTTTTTTNINNRNNKHLASTNAVRQANQHFFLVPAYKDQNFLREECELAQAQVSKLVNKSPTTTTTINDKSYRRAVALPSVDIRINTKNNYNNNNNNSTKTSTATSLVALTTNGMRRSGNGTQLGKTAAAATTTTTTTNTTATPSFTPSIIKMDQHSMGLGPQCKGFSTTTTTTLHTITTANKKPKSTANLTSVNSIYGATTKLSSRHPHQHHHHHHHHHHQQQQQHSIKPLIHRNAVEVLISGGVTSLSAPLNINQKPQQNSNNNGSNGSLNSIANNIGNNNMQTSLDQADDIKFIDSDEQQYNGANIMAERKSHGGCSLAHLHSHGVKNRTRPKSTILCSASVNPFTTTATTIITTTTITTNRQPSNFAKINNSYKYTNGTTTTTAVGGAVEKRQHQQQHTPHSTPVVIDSNSIQASIEKFNNLSEQKRSPLQASVTLRSHGGSGSTNSLQHHRHSSDFDNCNLRLPNSGGGSNSAGGSLTRSPLRNSVSNAGNKSSPSHHISTVSTGSTVTKSARHVSATNNTINNTGSLPLKGTRHFVHNDESTISGLSSSVDGDFSKKKIASISGGLSDATHDPMRSSLLPATASPTPSRYWDRDRDSTRSTLLSSSTSHSSHDIDDGGKKSTKYEDTEGLCGLRNIGNTCFMNSVIQCLSHTNELTRFLRNYSAARSPTSKDQQILYEFSKLIKDMWAPNAHCVTPMELKRAFSAKHRMYSDYNQQDAQEFLRFFLDSLHSALNTGGKGDHLRIDDNLSDNKKADLTWEWYGRHENSIIRDLFVGQLKSTLRCTTCGNASVTFDPFWDLSVPLPSSSRCKLEACLDLFIREEVLDGDEMPTCSKCQTRRKCTKSFTIQRFPKYLVIHLKRFSETRWSKLSNIVEFPTGERALNMAPYAANANSNINYSLYAISNHMGSTAGGHYVAICKHPTSSKWHEFNDNLVSDTLSEHHLVSSSAYILFYERA